MMYNHLFLGFSFSKAQHHFSVANRILMGTNNTSESRPFLNVSYKNFSLITLLKSPVNEFQIFDIYRMSLQHQNKVIIL